MSARHVRFESKTPKSINSLAQILARTLSETLAELVCDWKAAPQSWGKAMVLYSAAAGGV